MLIRLDPGSMSHSRASAVQSLSCIRLFATPRTAARQAFLSITSSWSLLKLMSVESVMPSNHLIRCCPLLLPLQSFPASGSFPMSRFFRWPKLCKCSQFSSVAQSCPIPCDPWTAARQASLSITNSQSLLKLMSVESVMPSNHLLLCRPLLPPSIFSSIRVFSNESVLCIR